MLYQKQLIDKSNVGKLCTYCKMSYHHRADCKSPAMREFKLKNGKRKPETVGELLLTLPDLRQAHPAVKEEIMPEVRLSDQPLKQPIDWESWGYVAYIPGATLVILEMFWRWPFT